MLLYSETIMSFLSYARHLAKDIVRNELQLEFARSRFSHRGYLWPLNLVVFEKPGLLGHFDYQGLQIGLHKRLLYQAKEEVLKNILRHELAHYLAYIEYGPQVSSHGPEFRQICKRYGWEKLVSGASSNLSEENERVLSDQEEERLTEKIKKLLALADSQNQHEAQLATVRANDLLLRHNLEKSRLLGSQGKEEDIIYVKRVLEFRRKSGKTHAIYEILRTFLVEPVYSYSKDVGFLEVTGRKTNVEIAEYVAHHLDRELERLWDLARKEHRGLGGINSKNSFMKGVSAGYREKVKAQANSRSREDERALMKIEQDLKAKLKWVYPNTRSVHSSYREDCPYSLYLGESAGRDLSLRPGIKNKAKTLYLN